MTVALTGRTVSDTSVCFQSLLGPEKKLEILGLGDTRWEFFVMDIISNDTVISV